VRLFLYDKANFFKHEKVTGTMKIDLIFFLQVVVTNTVPHDFASKYDTNKIKPNETLFNYFDVHFFLF